jgi:hypothetical protein
MVYRRKKDRRSTLTGLLRWVMIKHRRIEWREGVRMMVHAQAVVPNADGSSSYLGISFDTELIQSVKVPDGNIGGSVVRIKSGQDILVCESYYTMTTRIERVKSKAAAK